MWRRLYYASFRVLFVGFRNSVIRSIILPSLGSFTFTNLRTFPILRVHTYAMNVLGRVPVKDKGLVFSGLRVVASETTVQLFYDGIRYSRALAFYFISVGSVVLWARGVSERLFRRLIFCFRMFCGGRLRYLQTKGGGLPMCRAEERVGV